MLNNDHTVNLRSGEINSPLNSETYELVKNEQASVATIREYLARINNFLDKDKAAYHSDYFEALRQQSNLYDYLTIAEEKENKTVNIEPKNYFRQGIKIPQEELDRKITLLIEDKNYSESELDLVLIYIAKETGVYKQDLKQYYQAKRNEMENKESEDLTRQNFTVLMNLEERRLNLADVIPPHYASLITSWCERLDLRPEAALTTLLSGLSSCFDYRTRVIGIKKTNFKQHSAIYAALCGESGTGKSILMRKFLYQPLARFQNQFEEQYQAEKKQIQREVDEYNALSKDVRLEAFPDGKPELPERAKRCFLTEATIESFAYLYKSHPGKTILYASEEINKLFKGLNQYKGGKGSDEEKIIELYDGSGLAIGRVGQDNNLYVEETGLAIFGGVQPDVLKEIWGDAQDREGKSSRFLYVYQPHSYPIIDLEDSEQVICPLEEQLEMLFGTVISSPVTTYYLSKAGYRKFAIFFNDLTNLAGKTDRPFLRHVCSKAKGQCLRLILNLHAINSVWQRQFTGIPQEIPQETVDKGILLTRFYIDQVKFLLKTICPDDKMTAELRDLYNFCKTRRRVSARDVKMGLWSFREVDSNTIREMFLTLENMGRGTVEGRGNRAKFISN